jgi:hypothetical protein
MAVGDLCRFACGGVWTAFEISCWGTRNVIKHLGLARACRNRRAGTGAWHLPSAVGAMLQRAPLPLGIRGPGAASETAATSAPRSHGGPGTRPHGPARTGRSRPGGVPRLGRPSPPEGPRSRGARPQPPACARATRPRQGRRACAVREVGGAIGGDQRRSDTWTSAQRLWPRPKGVR